MTTKLAPFAMLLSLAITSTASGQAPKPKDDTLGAMPPEGATYLFCDSLCNWVGAADKQPARWKVEDAVFTVGRGDIMTRGRFGDFQLHLEFNIPYMPDKTGQARGNSGVYLQGIYELQVLDSYGLPPKNNECGGIYQQITPALNACKPPLQWQTYDITFHAARAKDGQVGKARLTVVQNGLTIIDDKEIGRTPGGVAAIKEGDKGPILLQDHGNAVQYRNIWIKPLD